MPDGQPNRAFLSLGSNINPETNLPDVVHRLSRYGRISAVSSVWESAPVGFADQPNFLNAAVLLETEHSADELCRRIIPTVEQSLGRTRDPNNKNAPRTIDIDLSLFNRMTGEIGYRRVPDPEILQRPFVAIPLAELDADYVHPLRGTTLAEIAASFGNVSAAMQLRRDVLL